MRRGLLIIDRGSREREASDELERICGMIRQRGRYEYTGYCFLEVVPPFIEEGMKKALAGDLETLTIVPYFLYPGRKSKAAVTDAIRFQYNTKTKLIVTRPMSMHRTMIDLVESRISEALSGNVSKRDVDVLMICHGSKDPNARISIRYIVDGLAHTYRSVQYCFLELEEPNIAQGIDACMRKNPRTVVIVMYFLHEGAHVKRDVHEDLNPALEDAPMKNVLITKHIGADKRMADLIIERAREVEDAVR